MTQVQCPPAQNQYMQEKVLGELIFERIHVGPVFAREYRKIFSRNHFPHISQILEGIHFSALSANTCRACIRTRASTGKNSWQIIYVLVSCQGVMLLAKLKDQETWRGQDIHGS